MWETNTACTGSVMYGPTSAYGSEIIDTTVTTLHEVTVDGLDSDTSYHYAVVSEQTQSGDAAFKTSFTDAKPLKFTIYGDTRGTDSVHGTIVNNMLGCSPHFALHSGDFVNGGRNYNEWSPQFFDEATALMKNTVMFTTPGNHEYSGSGQVWYFDFFSCPENSTDEGWYSFDYGDCHVVSLNSEDDYSSGSTQYNWFVNDISSTGKKWKIVFLHKPAYSSGSHGGELSIQTHLVPLFEQYRVNIVFCGHDHLYERSLKNGVFYIVTGGGGAPLYPPNQKSNPYQVYAVDTHHYCLVELDDGPYLSFKAYNENNDCFDSFTYANLEVLKIFADEEKHVHIEWASTPSFVYDVDYKNNITDGWIPLNLSITASETHTLWIDDGTATGGIPPNSAGSRFYRVRFLQ